MRAMLILWPIVFVGALALWFRMADWPFIVDVLFVVGAMAGSMVVAVMLVAAWSVTFEKKRPGSSVGGSGP